MKIPKFLEKMVLNSENIREKIEIEKAKSVESAKTDFNKEVTNAINTSLEAAKKEWSLETAKTIEKKFGASRRYVVTSNTEDKMFANLYEDNKNYATLTTLFSDSPGSIQCAGRIRDAVIGGGYVIKKEEGSIGKKSDLKTLIKFFDQPNPDDTIETLTQVSIENYLGYGNFYWELVPTKGTAKSKNKEIAEIYPLDPIKMSILVDADLKKKGVLKKVGFKRETDSNKAIHYTADEIFHTRRPNRRADLYGRAVLEDNTSTLQLLLRALTFNINILKNGGRPPLQLILPEDSTESDAESVSAFWEKNYQGPHNAGKTLVSFKGAKAEPLGITPQDMAYLELFNYGIRLVSGQYGVPLFLAGFPEGTNRASSAESRRSFYISNVFILRKLISQKITNDIIKKGKGIEGWRLDFKSAGLEEAESSRRDFMSGWSKGLYSFNESRLGMGLLPVEKEWADKYYLIGSKNDFMIEIDDAIKKEFPDDEKEDMPDAGSGRNPGDTDPTNDDRVAEPDRPSDGQ